MTGWENGPSFCCWHESVCSWEAQFSQHSCFCCTGVAALASFASFVDIWLFNSVSFSMMLWHRYRYSQHHWHQGDWHKVDLSLSFHLISPRALWFCSCFGGYLIWYWTIKETSIDDKRMNRHCFQQLWFEPRWPVRAINVRNPLKRNEDSVFLGGAFRLRLLVVDFYNPATTLLRPWTQHF